jgi:hypothetical protein
MKPKRSFIDTIPGKRIPDEYIGVNWKTVAYSEDVVDTEYNLMHDSLSLGLFYQDDPWNTNHIRIVDIYSYMIHQKIGVINSWSDLLGGFMLRDPAEFFAYFARLISNDRYMYSIRKELILDDNYVIIEGDSRALNFLYRFRGINHDIIRYSQELIRSKIHVMTHSANTINQSLLTTLNVPVSSYSELQSLPGRIARTDIKEAFLRYALCSTTCTRLNWYWNERHSASVETIVGCVLMIALCPKEILTSETVESIKRVFVNSFQGTNMDNVEQRLTENGIQWARLSYTQFNDSVAGFEDLNRVFRGHREVSIPLMVFGRRFGRLLCYTKRFGDLPNLDPGYDDLFDTNLYQCINRATELAADAAGNSRDRQQQFFKLAHQARRSRNTSQEAMKSLFNSIFDNLENFHDFILAQNINLDIISSNYFTDPFAYEDELKRDELKDEDNGHNDGNYIQHIFNEALNHRNEDVNDEHGQEYKEDRGYNELTYRAFVDMRMFDQNLNVERDTLIEDFDPVWFVGIILGVVSEGYSIPDINLGEMLTPMKLGAGITDRRDRLYLLNQIKTRFNTPMRSMDMITRAFSGDETYEKLVASHVPTYKRKIMDLVVQSVPYRSSCYSALFRHNALIHHDMLKLVRMAMYFWNIDNSYYTTFVRGNNTIIVPGIKLDKETMNKIMDEQVNMTMPFTIDDVSDDVTQFDIQGVGTRLVDFHRLTMAVVGNTMYSAGSGKNYVCTLPYALSQINYDSFSGVIDPISVGSRGGVAVTSSPVDIPFMIVSRDVSRISRQLKMIRSEICPLWTDDLIDHYFPEYHTIFESLSPIHTLSAPPIEITLESFVVPFRRF